MNEITVTASASPVTSFAGEYRFLSNFWACPVWIQVMTEPLFPSAEHAYQAFKARTREDVLRVLRAGSPGEAKRAGRSIAVRPDWEQVKRRVMLGVVLAKFADPGLAAGLAATGDSVLVEGNTWGDYYWGAIPGPALGQMIPRWTDGTLAGYNWLGRILMMVRDVIA